MHSELNDLKVENEKLTSENIELKGSLSYCDEILEVVKIKKRYDNKDASLAQVISSVISQQEQVLFVGLGSRSGIEKNMVSVYKNCIVGRVAEVYPFYSKVLCITDSRCKVSSRCLKTKSKGICVGKNSSEVLSLNFVEHFNKLKKGDILISDGNGLIFPKGFGLGKIDSFEKNGLVYSVDVKPIIDISSISYCYLMKKGGY